MIEPEPDDIEQAAQQCASAADMIASLIGAQAALVVAIVDGNLILGTPKKMPQKLVRSILSQTLACVTVAMEGDKK